MTPWLTPHFNYLVASFMLIRVFCVVQGCVGGGATGLLNKGGREQRFSKQQAVEFPQVLTSK